MRTRSRKLTAFFFLVILSAETLVPGAAYALTSGPSQPEMKQFEPAGASDMVDLFTGDLKYNIPLGDVDGYPLNLAYQSGSGMEEEASWVGAGWSLNPGALTRNMRGLPDDFNGVDKVTKEYDRKPFKKIGGTFILKSTLFGWEFGSGSVKVGVYKDNYYGIGSELGASLSFSLAKNTSTPMTAGLGINSDARDGVSISPSFSLSWARDDMENSPRMNLSGSFNYNTRAGLKQVSLGSTFSAVIKQKHEFKIELSAIQYFGQSYTPTIAQNSTNNGFTFSFDFGPSLWGGYVGVGGSGYVYNEKITDRITSAPAYGYMNYLQGRRNTDALLDFNREKDGVVLSGAPAIAVPVATPDMWTATNQSSSQAFRPFFSGNYIVFDKAHHNNTFNTQAGVTVGLGDGGMTGSRIEYTSGGSNTRKWVANNAWLNQAEADFDQSIKPTDEAVYFKQSGEHTAADADFIGRIGDEETQQVAINGGNFSNKAATFETLKSRDNTLNITEPIKKKDREKRTASISYLNAREAKKYALDKTINGEARDAGDRLPHHISEVMVTDGNGGRMVYGIPVYNLTQSEVSFSAPGITDKPSLEKARRNGLITYQVSNNKPQYKNGRDEMYSRETMPAYATSFLLTGVLSPDYVDLKGDGISDDDLGTAIKLNYVKHTNNYQWRAPYAERSANYNEGFISDPKDDKGSYVYGKKEIWYLDKMDGKTMVAVFETSPREDGLGVLNEHGGQNQSLKLRKLDRIKIYSRADYAKGASAIPVKTIHFEYDYSLYPQTPNNSGALVEVDDPQNPGGPKINLNAAKGKLTLKKVYFTFGNNNRGKSNPFEFEYDMRLIRSLPGIPFYDGAMPAADPTDGKEREDEYTERQQDRWGAYKHSRYNRLIPEGSQATSQVKMNNSEFPYTLQDNVNTSFDERDLINRFASKWQLNKITTPTGSIINVEYESDEYAYVQNRKAMQMCFVKSVGSGQQTNEGLISADGLKVELPVAVTGSDLVGAFKQMYLRGADGQYLDKIYYKLYTDLTNKGHYEYVQGYAALDLTHCTIQDNGKTAYIGLKKVAGKNPVSKAAWQMMKSDLPHYAYDNYDNSDATSFGDNYIAGIKSMVQAFINLREAFVSFDEIASGKDFANRIDLSKSMVRLYIPLGKKLGGGCRVKQLLINDNWKAMTDDVGKNASYGQVYNYLTKDAGGKEISSGVASYEPSIGNEENPFHEPVNFTEKVYWGLDRYHYVEKPFCESYFPAPSVGYSKVTVTSVGDDYALGGPLEKHTGYMEHEFYTARDFPTLVDNMPLEQREYENNLIVKLFSCTYVKRVVAAQGFKVEVNDMHGKPRSIKAFDKAGKLVSATETFYNVIDENAETLQLNNKVQVLREGGVVEKNVLIGTDVDFVTDMRESVSESVGKSVGAYVGVTTGFFFPIPYGSYVGNLSITTDSYHSTSSVKVIHKYGIPRKVRTTQNGSILTAENLVWDEETGQVVLTSSQNEFDDPLYAFKYPAHLAEREMGGAYKNVGAVFTNFYTGLNGEIPTSYYDYVYPGDELVSLDTDQRGWIIAQSTSEMNIYRLVDASGEFIDANGRYMVLRSGRRNLAGASVGTVVCMKDPRVPQGEDFKLELDVNKKILDAKAVLYNDQWAVDVKPQYSDYLTCSISDPQNCNCEGLRRFFDYLIHSQQLFIQQSANKRVKELVDEAITAGYNVSSCPILHLNRGKLFYALTSATSGTIYTAKIGDCIVSIRSKDANPVPFYYLESLPCTGNNTVDFASKTGKILVEKTYPVTCSQTVSHIPGPIYTVVNNSAKITAGAYIPDPGHGRNSNFKADGLSEVPANAEVISANLYLFAHPGGYEPPTYPNPHIRVTSGPSSNLYYIFETAPTQGNIWDCQSQPTIRTGGPIGSLLLTSENQDFAVDLTQGVANMILAQRNNGFSLGSGYTVAESGVTFTSHNYPDASKRPYLFVKYYLPAPPATVGATLSIDDCVNCPDPVGRPVNPYYTGLKGNWRPEYSMVYTVDREQKAGVPYQQGGTNIRQSGYYKTFEPFWTFGSQALQKKFQIADPTVPQEPDERWIWGTRPVHYDQKGNEIEGMDALKRYSAALFGYRESVATAVAANARRNEIAFDGFEDYGFILQNNLQENCPVPRHFDWGLAKSGSNWCAPGGCISTEQSHTGKYSLKLTGTATIEKQAGNAAPATNFLDFDNYGRYTLLDNELAAGFRPINGKKYILSCWVKDNMPNANKINGLTVSINGLNRNVNNIVVPVVEEWKRLELEFVAGSTFNLQLSGSNLYVDDIRIFPFDGQLTSFAYDDVTMRLMAQMDENNFATFYEYDDEGTPIRVKKETDRGIMTIKENRQFFRKRN